LRKGNPALLDSPGCGCYLCPVQRSMHRDRAAGVYISGHADPMWWLLPLVCGNVLIGGDSTLSLGTALNEREICSSIAWRDCLSDSICQGAAWSRWFFSISEIREWRSARCTQRCWYLRNGGFGASLTGCLGFNPLFIASSSGSLSPKPNLIKKQPFSK